jgi:hypothetical protein
MSYFDRIPEIIGALIPLVLFVVIPVLTIFRAIRNRGNSNKYNSQKLGSWDNLSVLSDKNNLYNSSDDVYYSPANAYHPCNVHHQNHDLIQ